jgi:hypothetical protein
MPTTISRPTCYWLHVTRVRRCGVFQQLDIRNNWSPASRDTGARTHTHTHTQRRSYELNFFLSLRNTNKLKRRDCDRRRLHPPQKRHKITHTHTHTPAISVETLHIQNHFATVTLNHLAADFRIPSTQMAMEFQYDVSTDFMNHQGVSWFLLAFLLPPHHDTFFFLTIF